MIHEAVAVVTAIFPGRMQTNHHLVPPTVLAQMLREACEVAFGQPLQLSYHLLSPVHGVETVHPKHNLDLDFQGEQTAKRLVVGIDQPSTVHPDTVNLRQLTSPLDIPLFILWCPPIPASRQALGSRLKKCTHGGHPLESPLVFRLPHVMALHHSDPLVESLNHVARPVLAHSSLFSVADQDGELAAIDCAVLRTYCDPVRHVKDSSPPPDGSRMFPRPV